MIMKCHNCMHVWNYTGKRLKYANCPQCHYNCMIKKDTVKEKDNRVRQKRITNIDNEFNPENRITGIKVKCERCNHEWLYHGKLRIVRCANCNARIYLD